MLIRGHLDHITLLDRQIAAIEDEIEAALNTIPAAQGIAADGTRSRSPARTPPSCPPRSGSRRSPA
jgi:hypothetical protein